LVITVGAADIHARALSVGALIAFLGSVGSLYGPARSLAGAWSRFHRAAAGAQRVAELLDTPSRVQERKGARSLGRVRGALEFRDVRFGYVRGPEVLKGVCFAVQPGETVAVVGSSGAGKSTLVGLALRLHDPTGGSVRIDGEDLTELTLQSVRRAVCPVFQDAYVFRGSVRENLAYGAPDADEQRLLAAARAAHADGFVEALQGRYAASVGPRGGWLSGGQRQRLALARALVRDAPILILDEATAALDSETEDLVQDAMSRLAGSRTLLVVAHRLSSVQRADRVIVLHEGRVVESAPPQTLLAGPSRCRELFAGQLAGLRPAA
jgi:ABC-type multidrug transport system fused ATPase/permease subunit